VGSQARGPDGGVEAGGRADQQRRPDPAATAPAGMTIRQRLADRRLVVYHQDAHASIVGTIAEGKLNEWRPSPR
jgi:hypothetical protein